MRFVNIYGSIINLDSISFMEYRELHIENGGPSSYSGFYLRDAEKSQKYYDEGEVHPEKKNEYVDFTKRAYVKGYGTVMYPQFGGTVTVELMTPEEIVSLPEVGKK